MSTIERSVPARVSSGRYIQTKARPGSEQEGFLAAQNWADAGHISEIVKSSVGAVGVGSFPLNSVIADLLGTVRRFSALSKLRGVHRAPIGVRTVSVGARPNAFVVAEGMSGPVSSMSFNPVVLPPQKVMSLVVVSDALLRATSMQAQQSIADLVLSSVAYAADLAFVSSITGCPTVAASGSTVAAMDTDMGAAISTLLAGGADLATAQWLIPSQILTRMALLHGSGGALAYPNLTLDGGTVAGLPVVVINGATGAAATTITLVNGNGILLSEDAEDAIEITRSSNAAIQMLDSPTGNSLNPTPTSLVSLFQTDSTAMRGLWHVSFWVDVQSAVQITGVTF